MKNTTKRKAILFIRVDAYDVYFYSETKVNRRRELEIYCNRKNIEILACHFLIAHCESFEDGFIAALNQNMYRITEQVDSLLMCDSYEISDAIISAADLIVRVKQLGLELIIIKDL